nr:hypothetical protein [Tanacetum cinerariifolium]
MTTPAYVDSGTITHADGAQSSRVPILLPDYLYVAVRHAQQVDTDTESDPEEAPSEVEEFHSLGSRVPLMGEEFEAFESIGDEDTEEDESLVTDDEREGHGLGDEDHGLDNERALRRHELAVEEDKVPSTFEGVRALEIEAQLELYGSILHDHTQHLDVLPPTLFADIDRDMRELYSRSGVRAAMQRELQEMKGRVTALEHERDHREQ